MVNKSSKSICYIDSESFQKTYGGKIINLNPVTAYVLISRLFYFEVL